MAFKGIVYDALGKSDILGEPASGAGTPTAGGRRQMLRLVQLAGTCLCWLAASSGIIIVNRHIMRELGFAFPMALSALGQLTSYFYAWFLCDVLKSVPPVDALIDRRYFLTRIAPVGAAQGVAMFLSNNLYLLLTVAFIEMARAMLPLVTLLALWAARVEVPTREHIQAVSLTGVGCAIAAYGEVALSLLGLICLGSNFTLEAARLVMLQFLMQGHNMNAWQSLKLMSLPSALMLVAMSLCLESGAMQRANALGIVLSHPLEFAAAATLGLAVNYLSNRIIKTSSATTVKLLAAVRGPLVVLSGVLMFAESVATIQFVGYSIALIGFVWYNVAKARSPGVKGSPGHPGVKGSPGLKDSPAAKP